MNIVRAELSRQLQTPLALSIAFLMILPAAAGARPPQLPMATAKFEAKSLTEGYRETHINDFPFNDSSYSCKRLSRKTIECTSELIFWTEMHGCYLAPDGLGDGMLGPCAYGYRTEHRWVGEAHSWKMRVRQTATWKQGKHWNGRITDFFVRDKRATLDTSDPEFGGKALVIKLVSGCLSRVCAPEAGTDVL